MPHKDDEARRAYYRAWKQGQKKRLSDKYYTAARHANERAARAGVDGRLTTDDVRSALDGKVCAYCGGNDRIGVDHVVPLAQGGANERQNIVACCHSCNARKRLADKPGRWSSLYEACVECGLTEKPHAAKGLCQRCRNRQDHLSRKPRGKRRSSS